MDDPEPQQPQTQWWKPKPATYAMWALAGWCSVLGWIGMHRQITGNDPAGNGMATGFVQGFAEAGVELTAILVGLFLLIRWKPARYLCLTILSLLSFAMFILVR